MSHATLSDRLLVALTGDDVIPFLQGIITQDATRLAKGEALYTALLSPQGKFLHDFFLIPQEGRVLLDVHRARADDLLTRMKMYRLRSKVGFEPLPNEISVVAVWNEDVDGVTDPRLPQLGKRMYGVSGMSSADDYEAHRIALGVPDGAIDMTPEKSLLLEFGFEDLHGVSFTKGCYVGQELTARTKYRANIRKHLFIVRAEQVLPIKGSAILYQDKAIGEMLSVHGKNGLALLALDAVEVSGGSLVCEAIEVHAQFPKWLQHPPQKPE